MVLVDGPPLLARTEAPNLARLAGHVVAIVEADKTPQANVTEALAAEGCQRVSLMLNKVTRRGSDRHGYGYGYGYGRVRVRVKDSEATERCTATSSV
jgi:hypothetical protein